MLALLTAVPAVQAGPDVCPHGDCVTVTASVGTGGADISVTERVDGGGAGVFAHAGPDGVDVDWGVGITNCHNHVGLDEVVLHDCVF